ncbi:DUF998 domain-containing protein [Streptomyces reniochalinae]
MPITTDAPAAAPAPTSDRRTRALLACGVGPLLFIVVILIEGAFRPGYSALHHWGSELSLSEYGWQQIINFLVAGVMTLAFAVGLRRALAPRGGPGAAAIPLLTGLLGVCLIVQGVFVCDPYVGYPAGSQGTADASFHGWVHGINMFPTFVAYSGVILAAAYCAFRRRDGLPWALFSLIAGIVVPVALYIGITRFNMDTQTGTYHGLWQRISLGTGGLWFALLAARLLRRHDSHPRSTAATG